MVGNRVKLLHDWCMMCSCQGLCKPCRTLMRFSPIGNHAYGSIPDRAPKCRCIIFDSLDFLMDKAKSELGNSELEEYHKNIPYLL
jgi:hypothetical protein